MEGSNPPTLVPRWMVPCSPVPARYMEGPQYPCTATSMDGALSSLPSLLNGGFPSTPLFPPLRVPSPPCPHPSMEGTIPYPVPSMEELLSTPPCPLNGGFPSPYPAPFMEGPQYSYPAPSMNGPLSCWP